MHFRPATEADIPLLRTLADEIWHHSYPGIITAEQIEFMLGWMYSEAQIRAELGKGIAWELMETADEGVVGFLSYQCEPDGRAKLNKLYVRPSFQGRGFGQQALAHVLETVSQRGASALWLQVNKRNTRAVESYRKAGFHIAQEAVFEIGEGFVMDDYLMEKSTGVAAQS